MAGSVSRNKPERGMQGSNLTDILLGRHITCSCWGGLLKINLCVGWGYPYLCWQGLFCKSLRTVARRRMAAGGDGAGPASLSDQLQPCHLCPVPRAGVHAMHLQTMEIALHMSQELARRTHCLAQCISEC